MKMAAVRSVYNHTGVLEVSLLLTGSTVHKERQAALFHVLRRVES